jgi:hypothetical protein
MKDRGNRRHAGALGGLVLVLGSLAIGARGAQESAGLRYYARAKEGGAKVYTLYDTKSEVLRELSAGSLVAVYDERAGFYEVEVPGGVPVWVYGEYLREASAGTYEVTGDRVRMRSLPNSGPASYPLSQKLSSGQSVYVIERADDTRPLREDWVRIWSPPGTRAWVPSADVVAVAAGTDVRSEWAAATRETHQATRAAEVATRPASSAGAPAAAAVAASETSKKLEVPATGKPEERARALFQLAEEEMEKLGRDETIELAPLEAAYREVRELAPASTYATLADKRISELEARRLLSELERDLEQKKAEHQAQLEEHERQLAKKDLRKDPLWGRFDARGWLEKADRSWLEDQKRAVMYDEATPDAYLLRWAGDVVAEVVCSSGRFDVALFEGFELGINGARLGESVRATDSQGGHPRVIDASRIEVLSGRFTDL